MKREDISEILEKIGREALTPEEEAKVKLWLFQLHQKEPSTLSEEQIRSASQEIWTKLGRLQLEQFQPEQPQKMGRIRKLWRIRAAVASVALILLAGGLFYIHQQQSTSVYGQFGGDVAPGGNRATLTLGDGRQIDLSDDKSGIIIDNSTIKYTDGGFVIQSDSEGSLSARQEDKNVPERQLALTTPKGGQYQVVLSDGTRVWLNAASSLKYPSRFTGNKRTVELSGEAYFEVNHNAKLPFIVVSRGQEVEVLGTHFNIAAYNDEADTKTTLFEGSVRVTTRPFNLNPDAGALPNPPGAAEEAVSTILKPNQQSIISITAKSNTINVTNIDPSLAIAWQQGYFHFDDLNLEPIMRTISRWYGVEIEYEGTIPDTKFSGRISRNKNISQVLDLLESTGKVSFKISSEKTSNRERRVIVTK